ncbi:TetR/AcrR family transcriptional regulator [Terribacillus saccharophilus]|uniref:TetR/AcrR family transcriptional regulator n=1 Tax=Terribacillus saccharophilus TaxID=361277 RepID=UPI001FEED7EF|nr:TetR/AcrR family transcriptional regulator C-terminal domain-containing protein [Terribacillus goriensis]MEC0283313.1 TetR/AcrR family transcriptional regulator C-terminal domain-containing protein [Terribacillus saccharophilus]MEC0290269.1 TetR/AcrR family transcriptional regulator C-terminal domain-containing protein [Terribacillus saccharophilus]
MSQFVEWFYISGKVDRRVAKTQDAIKKAFLELMNEKKFEAITIQDISDRANLNRSTIYLHYLDKYDLLDKLIDQHIQTLTEMDIWACEEEWEDAILIYVKYFEDNSLFFSTMLTSKAAAPSFRSKFLKYARDGFKKELEGSNVNNKGLSDDIIVEFASNAYVGVLETWLKEGMTSTSQSLAKDLGILLERIL